MILVAPVTGDSEDADRTTRPRPTVGGRLARLLTTHGLLEHGYGVARYVSIEQRMFDTKNAYHAALFASQRQWHQGDARRLAMDRVPRRHS